MKDIQKLQEERMTARQEVQQLEVLKQEEQELKQSEAELRLERDEVSLKRAKTLQEIRSARRNLVEAQNVKLSIEKGVVGDLESVIGKAADRVILSQLTNRTKYTEEELEELKQAAQTEIGKSLQDTLPSAWVERTTQNFGIIRRRARDVEIVRTDWIEGDFQSLMTEGPDAMIRRVISRTQKPGGGAYTAEEVDDYVSGGIPKELSQVAIDRILFWKYNNTGFGRVDIDSIASSPWGAEWYQKAVDKTESAQQELDSAQADGAVNNTNYRDRLGQIAGSRSRIGSVLFSPIWAIMAMRQPHLYRQRPAPTPAGATP